MEERCLVSESRATEQRKLDDGALRDLAAVMATVVIIKQTVLSFSLLYAGPVSTFLTMALATYLLRRRGTSWKCLGLRWPKSWIETAGLTVLTIFVFALSMELMEVVADKYFEDKEASGRFDHIEGNVGAYLVILFLTWTHASFFEELLFRAFIIGKTSRFLGEGLWADLFAVVFAAIFFGYRHYYYQGMNGALKTGAAGLSLGLLYLWFGRRNILPLALAHGVVNSLGMTLRFLGIDD